MHAGGSSQRLPSASVLGKAFITIPIGKLLVYACYCRTVCNCHAYYNVLSLETA